MRRLWFLGILLCITGAEATLKNSMPTPYLEAFKQDANAKEAANPGSYILQAKTDKQELCLTFDDGPDNHITPAVLRVLKNAGVKAAFFFLGEQIEHFPTVVKQALNEGHLVLSHGYRHRDFRKRSSESVEREEIRKSKELIEALGGEDVKMFRPPYGAVTDEQIRYFASRGYRIINWSVDSFDWQKGAKEQEIVDTVLHYAHPGAIILMHSGSANKNSPKALERIIRGLKEKGYRFVRLDKLLAN